MKISDTLFDRIGFCNVDDFNEYETELNHWQSWIEQGKAAGLEYMKYRKKPADLLAGVHGAVVCLLNYFTPESSPVARYARGRDYHFIIWEKLHALAKELNLKEGEYIACCDTMPLLERALAVKAGLGWIGRNNCLINKDLGSFCFIGLLLTTQHYDNPQPARNGCRTCHRCIDNCPTKALADHDLDCRHCLSYRTIEARQPLTADEARHNIVFGCDLCQEVCPWNKRFAKPHQHPELCTADIHIPELTRSKVRGTALSRAPLSKIKQNYDLCISNHLNS